MRMKIANLINWVPFAKDCIQMPEMYILSKKSDRSAIKNRTFSGV